MAIEDRYLEETAAFFENRAKQPTTLLTVRQVALELQLHERTVWRWIKEKRLRAIRLSDRATRISRQDLDDYVDSVKTAW